MTLTQKEKLHSFLEKVIIESEKKGPTINGKKREWI